MIYLIDDKKNRQETDFSWNTERFEIFKDIISPIYTLEDLVELSDEVFRPNNTVIYHESFLNGTELKDEAIEKRMKLENYASSNYDFKLAIFSGSISSRTINENIAYLPVATMYQNLEYLVKKDIPLLKVLLFGEFPEIEKDLSDSLDKSNEISLNEEQIEIENSNVLFIRPQKRNIQSPIKDANEVTLFNKVSDSDLSNKVKDWLNEHKYNLIYVPISFGPVLSDFNGLRLATHIRCTKSLNQTTKIIIYSFTSVSNLFNSPYFNILKTKNTTLITHRKSSMLSEGIKEIDELQIQDLPKELSKLKLDVPLNYEDSHSISNEWAIYRWAECLNIDFEDEFESIYNAVNHNIYFKYLKNIFPLQKSNQLNTENLGIKKIGKPKVLFVDDEVEKGWNELLVQIIYDNGISFESMGSDFKTLTQRKIIEKVLKKITDQNIDIVILDFRLTESDFHTKKSDEITSIKLIHAIKQINPGIQVLVLSATSKVWNYQAIIKSGADGFVIKESPINSVNGSFTAKSIKQLVLQLNDAIERSFLKTIFISLNKIDSNLSSLDYEDKTDYSDFLFGLKNQLKIIFEGAKMIDLSKKSTLDIVFLSCFNFLEQFKHNYYLNFIDNQYVLGIDEIEMNEYYPGKGGIINNGKFIPENSNHKPSWFNTMSSLFIDYFEICYAKDNLIKNLNLIKNNRNDFIHNKKEHFSQENLKLIIDLIFVVTKEMKE